MFDGETYNHARDFSRLSSQLERVRAFMAGGDWHTLDEIVTATGGTVASASARLRDLRKEKFGGLKIERAHLGNGLFTYRLAA